MKILKECLILSMANTYLESAHKLKLLMERISEKITAICPRASILAKDPLEMNNLTSEPDQQVKGNIMFR